jgi:hypothetical protein
MKRGYGQYCPLALAVRVESNLRVFIEAWRGIRDLRQEIQSGRVRLLGPVALRRRFPDWLRLSSLAPYPRQWPGRKQRLACTSPTA